MKQHLIALTGFAGTGKDTIAGLLSMHFGFRVMAFADALRAEVAEAFGVDPMFLTDPRLKNEPINALAMGRAPLGFLGAVALSVGNEARTPAGYISNAWLDTPRSPRQVLQWWGTEYRRRQSPRYWTGIVTQRVNEARRNGEARIVLTDCRFENEADTVRAMGGLIWQVKRPGIDATNTPEGMHASATDGTAFGPDAVINNIYDIRHLQQLVLSEFVALETGLETAKVSVTV